MKKHNIKKVYENKKAVTIKDILSDKEWEIENVDYNEETGKYEFIATHKDGRKIAMQRNRQYVDNLINELLYVKRGKQ